MCGIFGYIGEKQALPILIDGLKHLEYRGYDSAGVAILNRKILAFKATGKLLNLENKINGKQIEGKTGIGHTRWATHGAPSEANAHPHYDCAKNIWIAHNGIIENYKVLKEELVKKGHHFRSKTDSEVIAHLIEEIQEEKNLSLKESVRLALKLLRGAYGLIVLSKKEPDKIIAVKNSSPLIIGTGNNENFIASDAGALLPHTREIIYLDDGEIAVVGKNNFEIQDFDNNIREKQPRLIDWSLEKISKQGYPHFMLKEIFEGPEVIENSIRGRLTEEQGIVKLGGLRISKRGAPQD